MNDYTTTESNDNMEFSKIYIPSYFFTKPYESCENIDDKPIFKKEYLINGLSFYEEPCKDVNAVQEFEITTDKDKLEIKILERYSRVYDKSSDQDVEIYMRETPCGVIINDCVFIAEDYWHSIEYEQCDVRCLVCDVTVDELEDHIKLKRHVDNLNKYDLYFFNKFNENIMRKIGDDYRCLICDEIVDVLNIEKHFESEEHADELLSSMKDVSAIVNFELELDKDIDYSDSRTSKDSDENESVISSYDENISDNNISSIDNENDDRRNLTKVEEPYNFEFIYLKFKNNYIKVSYKSYNGLINIGDSINFCFLCSLVVHGSLKEHMEDENHFIHLKNCHFIDWSNNHLLRQNSFVYHCCNCNIILKKEQLLAHLKRQEKQFKSDKKTRKKDLKSGIKQINIKTIQDSAVSNEKLKITIITKIDLSQVDGISGIENCKIVVENNGNGLKFSWNNWHGFSITKFGTYCILCQRHLKVYEVKTHIYEEKHTSVVEKSFETKFLPSLIRKINDNKLHCLICNVSVLDNSVFDHINSKKHKNSLTIKHVDFENLCRNVILNF